MVASCCACYCKNRCRKGSNIRFYKFPLNDKPLLSKWITALRRDKWLPTPSSKLCSVHFTDDCFRVYHYQIRLREDAVPTIFQFPDISQVDLQQSDREKKSFTRSNKRKIPKTDETLAAECLLELSFAQKDIKSEPVAQQDQTKPAVQMDYAKPAVKKIKVESSASEVLEKKCQEIAVQTEIVQPSACEVLEKKCCQEKAVQTEIVNSADQSVQTVYDKEYLDVKIENIILKNRLKLLQEKNDSLNIQTMDS